MNTLYDIDFTTSTVITRGKQGVNFIFGPIVQTAHQKFKGLRR